MMADVSLIGEIASTGTLAISTINLLISRLDKHHDALEHPESISALMDLEHLLSSWVNDTVRTNNAVQGFTEGRNGWGDVEYAVNTQQNHFLGVEYAIDSDRNIRESWKQKIVKKQNDLAQFLRIYAPEFSEAFQAAARGRYRLLHQIQYGPWSYPRDEVNTRELSKALTTSSEDLAKSLSNLRRFMRDNAKPK